MVNESPSLFGGGARRCAKLCQRGTIEAHHGPVVHRPRTKRLVEADRRFVPVEHRPFEPRAATLDCQCGEVGEQRLAKSAAARRGAHEEVLKVDPWAPL